MIVNEEQISKLWQDYENARSYAAAAGLRKDLPKFVDFYEGKQWPAPTKNTKNLPRPVINIVKMICRSKKSSILSTPVRLVYEADDPNVDIERFNNFAEYILKEMDIASLDKRAVQNGIIEGTYIYHFYWDADAEGRSALHKGALRCEIIDPLNIFFADPTQPDEQKQKWIIIKSREEVSSVRAKADQGVEEDLIKPDDADDPYGDPEQDGDKLCTVLTRYFRRDGEVHFEKAVKGTIVNAARPVCPDVEKELKKIREASSTVDAEPGVDAPNNTTPDTPGVGEDLKKRSKFYLYPVVVGSYEARKGSIYGIGEVEGIIPNQKAINFLAAMVILNNREVAWGKYVVLPNALNGQKITDEPGQVLVDHSNTGNGIRKITEQSLQGQPLQVIDMIAQLTRKMTGATEVLSGEVIGANMSGSAIAQLQAQAKEPVKELRDAFWIVKKKQGLVLAQFFKTYYEGQSYTFSFYDKKSGQMIFGEDEFNSFAYADVDFSVVVEATSGTNASSAGDISALDALYAKGAISVETYIESYPDDALSNKSELLRRVKAEQQSRAAQLTAQIQAQEKQLQQYAAAVKQLQEILKQQQLTADRASAVIAENRKLKEQYLALYVEAKGKLDEANGEIARGNAALTETTADAQRFARHIFESEKSSGNMTGGMDAGAEEETGKPAPSGTALK